MDLLPLSNFIEHQNEFITINDNKEYTRVTAKLHRKGIVLRDYINGFEIKTKKQQICEAEQLLVAEIDAKVGGYGIVPKKLEGAIVSSHYYLFNIISKKLLPSYLAYVLKTDEFFSQIKAQGSTNYAAIRPKDILEIKIPYCSVELQRSIIEKLDKIIANISHMQNSLLKEKNYVSKLHQAILDEALSGKLVPQDPNDEPASELLKKIEPEKGKIKSLEELSHISEEETPYELPNGWKWVRFSQIIFLRHGHQFRRHDFVDSGIPIIKIGQCKSGIGLNLSQCNYISEDRLKEYEDYLIKKGDVLMALTGGTLGKVTLVEKNYGSVLQNYRVGHFSPIREDVIGKNFIILILRS